MVTQILNLQGVTLGKPRVTIHTKTNGGMSDFSAGENKADHGG
jgi:hypothetical protein